MSGFFNRRKPRRSLRALSRATQSVPQRGSAWLSVGNTIDKISFNYSILILIMWNRTDTPLAYFVTFRTYGTSLHGDSRGSIDRFHNRYGAPYLQPSKPWLRYKQLLLKTRPLIFSTRQRRIVDEAIRETCRIRNWSLLALNVRTNHVHVVVTANKDPKLILNAFKANATRRLREEGQWRYRSSPWAFKGSKRLLWNEKSIERAIDYVLYGQGDDVPDSDA